MKGYITDIEKLSLENENFRKVLYTDKNSQNEALHSLSELRDIKHD